MECDIPIEERRVTISLSLFHAIILFRFFLLYSWSFRDFKRIFPVFFYWKCSSCMDFSRYFRRRQSSSKLFEHFPQNRCLLTQSKWHLSDFAQCNTRSSFMILFRQFVNFTSETHSSVGKCSYLCFLHGTTWRQDQSTMYRIRTPERRAEVSSYSTGVWSYRLTTYSYAWRS